MVLVPCCQAEVAGVLRKNKALALARTPLAELWRHPLHTREIGSQITNVLRCLYLEANGYQVTVTELVGWEHSMKNELIIARHTGQRKAQRGRAPARHCWPSSGSSPAVERFRLQLGVRLQFAVVHGPPSPSHRSPATAPRHPARQQPPGIFVDRADYEMLLDLLGENARKLRRRAACLCADGQPLPPAGDAASRPTASRR